MAGIYIHIPFCKVKCNYCDFHFSTNNKYLPQMVNAISKEIELRKSYLQNEAVDTIYFGGGTPSVLSEENLSQIINVLERNFTINPNAEITFECNPDDLTRSKLQVLNQLGINRLSIGIQSFDNDQLTFMNRAHNANEAVECIKIAQEIGFNNITIDLIYGLPNTDDNYWLSQIKKALSYNVPHISAYCLTIEKNTAFGNWYDKGKLTLLNDELSLNQFKVLTDQLKSAGYEHYEISNFAKQDFISKHNSSYWLGKTYLGIGPSAHSFNGTSRQWNVSNNIKYIKAIDENKSFFEVEELTPKDQFNELLLTRLRTKWGVNLIDLFDIYKEAEISTTKQINAFVTSKDLKIENNVLFLTDKGKFIADHITAELFA